MRYAPVFLVLAACAGEGEWSLNTWGEDYIEEEIPSEEFADSCSATFDEFLVGMTGLGLIDGNGEFAATIDGALVFDVSQKGPHLVGTSPAPVGLYPTVEGRIAPSSDLAAGNASAEQVARLVDNGWSVAARGAITCGSDTVTFDWGFATDTTYTCDPEGLEVARGGAASSELTIHGDHFFYDGLEDPDAGVRGQALVDADANADGVLTLEELEGVDIAPLGYTVGQFGEVRDLRQFVTHLTSTLGHIDGEGHCAVTRN